MRFIHKWAFILSNIMMKELDENHEKRRVYYFSFQVIIGAIVKGCMLIAAAYLTGSVLPALLILLVFSTLRSLAGGYHMDTYGKCIIASTIMFIACSLLTQYTYFYWSKSMLEIFVGMIFVVSVWSIIKWAPKDTPNKLISEMHRAKFKKLSLLYIFIWFLFSGCFIYLSMNIIVLSLCAGVLLEIFSISPFGEHLFDIISGKLQNFNKKKSYNE